MRFQAMRTCDVQSRCVCVCVCVCVFVCLCVTHTVCVCSAGAPSHLDLLVVLHIQGLLNLRVIVCCWGSCVRVLVCCWCCVYVCPGGCAELICVQAPLKRSLWLLAHSARCCTCACVWCVTVCVCVVQQTRRFAVHSAHLFVEDGDGLGRLVSGLVHRLVDLVGGLGRWEAQQKKGVGGRGAAHCELARGVTRARARRLLPARHLAVRRAAHQGGQPASRRRGRAARVVGCAPEAGTPGEVAWNRGGRPRKNHRDRPARGGRSRRPGTSSLRHNHAHLVHGLLDLADGVALRGRAAAGAHGERLLRCLASWRGF